MTGVNTILETIRAFLGHVLFGIKRMNLNEMNCTNWNGIKSNDSYINKVKLGIEINLLEINWTQLKWTERNKLGRTGPQLRNFLSGLKVNLLTCEATVRLRATPPAFKLTRKIVTSGSSWNLLIALSLAVKVIDQSKRTKLMPDCNCQSLSEWCPPTTWPRIFNWISNYGK